MPDSTSHIQNLWKEHYTTYVNAYKSGEQSFMPNILPQTALQFTVYKTLEILHKRLGNEALRRALNPNQTIESPAKVHTNTSWLKRSNVVGVNVRTIGSFWNVINYSLTLPSVHDSIHLLPIWEPGVVGSLYGMISWQINPAFFDVDLARVIPELDSVEKQLKVVINLIHAMSRTVGMDVIPHTDRFSEMVLACPSLFEWVQRDEKGGNPAKFADHSSFVYRYVEDAIWNFLKFHGSADATSLTCSKDAFFSTDTSILTDDHRTRILFGLPNDYGGRLKRRIALIRHLTAQGFETLPMTMAPPYRGLHIDASDYVVDEYNQTWYQYAFNRPEKMSRVFGPLTRYRFYESKNNNRDWELDFNRPNVPAWEYFCQKVRECQQVYNFDFMRGDMAHVQMRPEGVPATIDPYYDPLRAVKKYVHAKGTPYFAFLAESFLAPPNTMGYGNEPDHLEAIEADTTLGDLQSMVVGSDTFRKQFADYYRYLKTRQFAPSFTVITADKDDPRFDQFYQTGNLFRYFTALFLNDMPSYVTLGFELRNLHEERSVNEEYSKLYVYQIEDDSWPDKVTHGPFIWGENFEQFEAISRVRIFAERIWPEIVGKETKWVVAADAGKRYVVWTHTDSVDDSTSGNSMPCYVFAASLIGDLPENLPDLPDGEVVFNEPTVCVWKVEK